MGPDRAAFAGILTTRRPVRHHRPGAPACRGCPPKAEQARRKKGVSHPEGEALGRSRGGLTTKLLLACDSNGRPVSVVVTPGQRHESTQLEAVLDAIRVKRPGGAGRPSKRPEQLIADRGYSYPSCRLLLRRRGIRHTIPERCDQREQRAGRPARRRSSTSISTGSATWPRGALTGSSSGGA